MLTILIEITLQKNVATRVCCEQKKVKNNNKQEGPEGPGTLT